MSPGSAARACAACQSSLSDTSGIGAVPTDDMRFAVVKCVSGRLPSLDGAHVVAGSIARSEKIVCCAGTATGLWLYSLRVVEQRLIHLSLRLMFLGTQRSEGMIRLTGEASITTALADADEALSE